MNAIPTNEYVEIRNGGYYVAGTRVALDQVVHAFRSGRTAEAILDSYPSIASLAKVYGAIAFILEHSAAIDAYLIDQDRAFGEIRARYPMSPALTERLRRSWHEVSTKH